MHNESSDREIDCIRSLLACNMMRKINTESSLYNRTKLRSAIDEKCRKTKKVLCRALNSRPIFLDKYLECLQWKKDQTNRMRLFFCALSLIKEATREDCTDYDKSIEGKSCFELIGMTKDGVIFCVHIREEISGWNKKLYLISCFEKQKKT